MTLLTIGDSHSFIPFRTIAKTRYMGAITMKRLGNPAEPLLHQCAAELAPQPGDVLIAVCGEIDVRCWAHVHVLRRKDGDAAAMLGEWAEAYLDKIASIPANGARLGVAAVVPPSPQTKIDRKEYPVAGTDEDRARYTALLNDALRRGAAARNLLFLDQHSPYAGPDGMMRPELADSSVHINDIGPLRAALAALQVLA